MCDEKETYIEEIIGDTVKDFIVRINQYIFEFKMRNFTCKFPRHFFLVILKVIVSKNQFLN